MKMNENEFCSYQLSNYYTHINLNIHVCMYLNHEFSKSYHAKYLVDLVMQNIFSF